LDWRGLEAYRVDPVHRELIEPMRRIAEISVEVDYEV
jgi:hypothetical protein